MPVPVRLSPHQRSVVEGHARGMRAAPTRSEELLFRAVGGRKLGVLFRRQVPVLGGRYVADLYAAAVRLVVEVDGGAHFGREAADARRDRALARAGYRVLRIETGVVERDVGVAVGRIREALEAAGIMRRP